MWSWFMGRRYLTIDAFVERKCNHFHKTTPLNLSDLVCQAHLSALRQSRTVTAVDS